MTLTPEQFNKIATKNELNEMKDDVKEIKQDVKQILKTVDGVAKNYKTVKTEQTANLGAHKRIQKDVNEVRGHVGLKIKNATL